MHQCLFDENIIFSFKYSINNKEFTIEKVTKKSKEKCNEKMQYLFEKLEELSNLKLLEFQDKPKAIGYEMIPLNQFNFMLNNRTMEDLKLTADSKIIVFRFGKQKYRIFMIQSKLCPALLYIIAYDWNYGAYNH